MKFNILTLIFFLKTSSIYCFWGRNQNDLVLVEQWNKLDFDFPTQELRDEAIAQGLFVAENAFPIDVDVDYADVIDDTRIFVTIPRFSTGIPITLGYLTISNNDVLIKAYPDYSWHSSHGDDCDGITSVLRIAIDECRQMYVLDTGKIGDTQKCPPQLLIFNLVDNSLVRRYKFPDSQYVGASLFVTPVVDVSDPPPTGTCSNAKVYIADVTGFSLIVYDTLTDTSWKIQNNLFYPYPNFGTFTIDGVSFDLMDGILGLALSPNTSPYERFLYFHSLASGVESSVPLSVINNPSTFESNPNAEPRAFVEIGSRGIQTAAQAMDRNGNLYFVLMDPLALVCWDSSTTYSEENIKILVENDETLQFASGLKIIEDCNGVEELWVMTIRLQKIWTGTLNFDETNFRIQALEVQQLLGRNGRCSGRPLRSSPFQPFSFLFK
ncbi:CLUMA_CG016415, isoform A [Clunio marinus]|uniref:CLUMA_CG016415, isoform A n=1 Tax=Clunio marinus TaxID=568069 RepID=A0A1J1IVL8_9DIPT|nr:CLUMA_CG016415, isoform A [Clunio marinus]